MRRYRCKEAFTIRIYDDEGWSTDEYRTIPEGSVWERDENDWRMVSFWGSVRLLRDYRQEGQIVRQWLEISKERLAECFEELELREQEEEDYDEEE